MDVGSMEERLRQQGIVLPAAAAPVAQYVPCKQSGNLVFVSGQGPILDGTPICVGRVGTDVTLREAYEAARQCALNALAALQMCLGSLDRIQDVVHVRGFVNSSNGFHGQPDVINGASDLLVELFGDAGKHARSALGTSNLPGNIPVELEVVVRVTDPLPERLAKGENDG